MKQEGFTLVELLAVIVILAIILAIAVPSIVNIIDNVTRDAFESDARMLIKAAEYKLLEDDTYDVTDLTHNNVESELNISGDNYESLTVSIDGNGNSYVIIHGQERWEGLIACGTSTTMEIVENEEACPEMAFQPIILSFPNSPYWGMFRALTDEQYADNSGVIWVSHNIPVSGPDDDPRLFACDNNVTWVDCDGGEGQLADLSSSGSSFSVEEGNEFYFVAIDGDWSSCTSYDVEFKQNDENGPDIGSFSFSTCD